MTAHLALIVALCLPALPVRWNPAPPPHVHVHPTVQIGGTIQ